jgi:D-beta-D-heptose 7-phosphate kinase/D-beta-D-heptose 1-phosphate adenosyltransferase
MLNTVELEAQLDALGHPRVLIVGDLILDRYVIGDVGRISPEAPIPILTARRAEERLGGAGNVAANLVAMGAKVDVVGVVGDDSWGRNLRELLKGLSAEDGCVVDASRPTVRKTRHMSGPQQMLRVDWEDSSPVSGEARETLANALPERVRRASAVVLSDYGKGVLTPAIIRSVIECARDAGVPVLVDPKGEDYTRYRGASLITPNRKEAEEALGRKLATVADVAEGAVDLLQLASLDAAVITLGSDGISFRTKAGDEGCVPAQARAVFDVTGAGDTVVAQLALYLAEKLPLHAAVALANHAAGIVVARLGTHAVTRAELRAQLTQGLPHEGKLLSDGDLDSCLVAWRNESKRIVFTNGCFDVLHAGHVDYLRFARSKGDLLIVGVNDDASVKRLKGPTRPVNELEDRMRVLAAMEMVDAVIAFGEDTPKEIVERITPDVLVKGQDWADKGVVGREWVEAHGGQVHLAPLVPGKSTTAIIERAKGGSSTPAS